MGTLVEFKAFRIEYRERRGRWWIRRRNHELLLEADGDYGLSVYEAAGDVVRQALVSALTVDAIVDGNWWDAGAGGKEADDRDEEDEPFFAVDFEDFF